MCRCLVKVVAVVTTTLLSKSLAAPTAGCLTVRDAASAQEVRMEMHGAHAIRVRAVPIGSTFRSDLVSALLPPTNGFGAAGMCPTTDLQAEGMPVSLTNGNLNVAVDMDGKLTFTRLSDGKVLIKEKTVRMLQPTITTPSIPGFLSLDLAFEAVEGERIYGLGQHAKLKWDPTGKDEGQLDNKGLKGLLLAPHDGDILIPVVHSSQGYAFLFNLPSLGNVEYNETVSYWHADAILQVDLWVATTADGPTHSVSPWAQLQTSYVDATGHSPVWPEWTTGFWQCKLRYSNQSQVIDIAQEYVDRQIPLSLMIIDYYSWNDPVAPKDKQNTLGDEILPKSCWPDPKLMVDQLREIGVELMVSPYSHSVSKTSSNYADAARDGLLATNSSGQPALGFAGGYIYDLFNPAARKYAYGKMYDGYISQYGLHHWWLDCDEPCGGTNNGSFGDHFVYNNGTWPAAFVGAAYPHMLDQMMYEGSGTAENVMLGRAAWAGSQRFGGGVWSGDTQSTWDDFNQQFRAGLNMMMSGITYWTTDIGGFAGGDTTSADFRELVVRWFQWGAFCPLFRLHGARTGPTWPPGDSGVCGATASNEIWSFGNESEAAIVRVMRIREQLRPYVMEQYIQAGKHGTPIARPLFFDFWSDVNAQMVDDQMMFGPDFLVAPVLKKGATSRYVYLPSLPKGSTWRNMFTGVLTDTSAGGKNISEPTPLTGDGFGTFPLYQRQSTIAHALSEFVV